MTVKEFTATYKGLIIISDYETLEYVTGVINFSTIPAEYMDKEIINLFPALNTEKLKPYIKTIREMKNLGEFPYVINNSLLIEIEI